ncbi:hypothetical protein RRG08_038353 [Elysia crispata]|uniref:Neurotransmitter-gated ion-channel ligand-binding domain-containing protein n=1 Tax=Elysia crispata TaxID=231223 RepID=A0AAE0YQ14_9GAST|nr:hypothetical protein RRG08_038353 [Elysia crispata]
MTRLLDDIFEDYTAAVSPRVDAQSPVHIDLSLRVSAIIDLSVKEQMLKIRAHMKFMWTDERLSWDPQKYGNIRFINSLQARVWRPDIVLSSLQGEFFIGSAETQVIMFHNGSVIWEPAFTATFGCEVHIPKYPLDESACKIVVGPWANYNSSIVMELHTPHMHLEETVSNGQFEVHLGDAYKRVFPYEQWFFEQVVFTLKLIRKPAHAFISLLLPLFVFSLTTLTPSSLAYCSLCLSSHSPPAHHHPQLIPPSVCLLTHHPHTIIPSLLLPLFVFSLTTHTPSSPAYCSLCLSSHSPPAHHHPQLIAPSVCLLTHHPHTIIPSLLLPLFVFSLTTRTPSSLAYCSLCLSSHSPPTHHHPQLTAPSVCLLTHHPHTIIPSLLLPLFVFSLTTRTPSSPAYCSLCLSSHLPPLHHHLQLTAHSFDFSLTTLTPSFLVYSSLCLSSHSPPSHHHPQLIAPSVCLLTHQPHTIIPSLFLPLFVFSLTTRTPSSPASCSLCLSSHLSPAHHHPQLPALSLPAPSVCLLTHHPHTIIPSLFLLLFVFSLTTRTPSSPAYSSLCLSSHSPPAHHHPQLPAPSVCLLTYHPHTIIPSFLLSLSVFSLTTRTPSSPAYSSLYLSSHSPPAHHHPQLPALSVCLLNYHQHTILPSFLLSLSVFSLTTRTPSSPASCSLCLSSHLPPAHHHPQLPALSVCLLTYHRHTIISSFLLSVCVFSLTTDTPSSPASCSLCVSSHSPPTHHHLQLPALCVCLLTHHRHTIIQSFLLSLCVFSLTTDTPSSPGSCSLCLSSHSPPAHHHPQLPALSVCLLTHHPHTIIVSLFLPLFVFSLTTLTPSSLAYSSLYLSSHSPPAHHHPQLTASSVCLLTHHPHTIIPSLFLPLFVLSLLGPVAFLIPPVDAEKVNMSVTVLLAIVVFTGLVHGNLPNRSDQTSMLVIYVSSLLVLAFFGVLGNTIVLAVHRKQNEQVQASTCSLPEGVSRDLCSSLKACHASIKQSDSGHSEKCSEAGSEKTCVLPAKLPPEPKLRAERLNMIFFVESKGCVLVKANACTTTLLKQQS